MPLITAACDRRGVCTLSEGGLLAEIGLQPGQVVGLSFLDIYGGFPEIVRDLTRCLNGESFATNAVGGGIAFETYYRPIVAADGTFDGGCLAAIDVAGRVHAVDELERSEGFRQSLLHVIPDRMLHLSSPFDVLSFKPGAADDGLTPSQWIGARSNSSPAGAWPISSSP